MTKPTTGAMKAAEILMGGKKMIDTDFGKKRLEGIADLIDRQTGLPELLKDAERAFTQIGEALIDNELEGDTWKDVHEKLGSVLAKFAPIKNHQTEPPEKTRYTVHLMTSYLTWEDVEAESEEDAIRQCDMPVSFDINEPHKFVAVEDL